MNELIPTIQNRDVPIEWNYDGEVKKGKKYFAMAKEGLTGLAKILYDGHNQFKSQGARSDLVQDWTKLKTFKIFHQDIGVAHSTAYWLLERYDPVLGIMNKERIKEEYLSDDRSSVSWGENIHFLSTKHIETRFDDHILDEGDIWPTLTCWGNFFYKSTGKEYDVREYARVQTFPDEFIFVGSSYRSYKDQIGNAVAPDMARHIGQELKGDTFGDLFAGCGGLSYGLMMLGKRAVWMVEKDRMATITYKTNHKETAIYLNDIKSLDPKDFEKVDIIVGGPPCQGFSLVGRRFKDDPRNKLYKEFVRFVEELKPKEFLMENVPQIKDIKDQIIEDFETIGYQVRTKIVKGLEIGMRQRRNRFFFIGERKEKTL